MKRLVFTSAARADLMTTVHGRYMLLYRDLEDEVRIVRLVHGARDLPRMFDA